MQKATLTPSSIPLMSDFLNLMHLETTLKKKKKVFYNMLKEISFLSLAQLTQITPTKHTPPGEVAVSCACFKVKIALSKRKYHKQR